MTETIFERWKRDTGFGTVPGEKGVSREDLVAHEPRDERGRWTRGQNVATDLAGSVDSDLRSAFEGTGIQVGPTGPETTVTPKDAEDLAAATREAVKKFPELKRPRGKAPEFEKLEFTSNAQSSWARDTAQSDYEMHLATNGAQTVGGETGRTGAGGHSGPTHILMNDSSAAGDGLHTALTDPPPGWFTTGSRDVRGQMMHELGHALTWAAGLTDWEGYISDGKVKSLFLKHGMASGERSDYGKSAPAEGFSEWFADYMRGDLSPQDRKDFEGLLSDMLGRPV